MQFGSCDLLAELSFVRGVTGVVHELGDPCGEGLVVPDVPQARVGVVVEQVRSAAYQALATMPAVRVEGPTTDPRGRSGIVVTFLIQGDRTPRSRLIVDPDTSKVLAVAVNEVFSAT
ncbi:MAG TPA: hypothetical protein VM347_31325 [Nonomuraea sp.]|nr:hypothetical protein [Nonomuraea sp.]